MGRRRIRTYTQWLTILYIADKLNGLQEVCTQKGIVAIWVGVEGEEEGNGRT